MAKRSVSKTADEQAVAPKSKPKASSATKKPSTSNSKTSKPVKSKAEKQKKASSVVEKVKAKPTQEASFDNTALKSLKKQLKAAKVELKGLVKAYKKLKNNVSKVK
jgi:hypothetical protein